MGSEMCIRDRSLRRSVPCPGEVPEDFHSPEVRQALGCHCGSSQGGPGSRWCGSNFLLGTCGAAFSCSFSSPRPSVSVCSGSCCANIRQGCGISSSDWFQCYSAPFWPVFSPSGAFFCLILELQCHCQFTNKFYRMFTDVSLVHALLLQF